MTTLTPGRLSDSIDPSRWPDVARIPGDLRARVAARVAERIFDRATGRVPIRVLLPDGRCAGGLAGDPSAPTMVVHEPARLMRRLGAGGLIGFGESYLAGEWDSADLAGVIAGFAGSVDDLVPGPLKWFRSAYLAHQPAADRPTGDHARHNVERHYDLSNEMFAGFLDETMSYSSALFCDPADATPASLAAAQDRKMDRILDQAGVGPGTRVLEIGTGWGALALRAAGRGAEVDSITLSSEQLSWARRSIEDAGLADRVHLALRDYRQVRGEYDAVVSVEMIEAVGLDFLPTFFDTVAGVLAPGGSAVLQVITMPHRRMLDTRRGYTWIHKYIFPGGALPSVELLRQTSSAAGLRERDLLAMGDSYAETLRLWAEQFEAAGESLGEMGFDEVFRRMWRFYLRYSEGGFRAGYLDVHQLTLSKDAA